MNRRDFARAVGAAAAASAVVRVGGDSGRRQPNIVLILTDDQGWGDVTCHGNDDLDTPTLDRIAAEGAAFELFYVCPVCAPTRASLLTGRYHLRTGTHWVTHGKEIMRSEELTFAEALRREGYATGCFGKWHNGAHFPHNPTAQGFEEFLGFCAGHWSNYFDTKLEHNGEEVRTEGYITDVLTDAALAFIEENRDRPFLCYVPYNCPHTPFQVPDAYFDRYKARGLDDATACIFGMVGNIDDSVARILDALDALRLAEDTIVIFTTDNGPNTERYNGGMRGRKGSVHEGGVRVPFFIRYPELIEPGRRIRKMGAHIDIFPTLLELCGVDLPEDGALDGVSLVPLLTGAADDWPSRVVFTQQSRRGEVERDPGSARTQQYRWVREGGNEQLYDMVADPGETRDICAEEPGVAGRMRAAYDAWFDDVTQRGFDPIPAPLGHTDAPIVTIDAPEARLNGPEFRFGMGWANDWIANWRSVDDRIEWSIDVVASGDYDVALLYACPPDQIGSRVRVTVGDASVETVLAAPHTPTPIASPDRVARGEAFEQDWAELLVGTLSLPLGLATVEVRATSVAADMVMDLKSIRFRRRG